jgi:hypothetical protein
MPRSQGTTTIELKSASGVTLSRFQAGFTVDTAESANCRFPLNAGGVVWRTAPYGHLPIRSVAACRRSQKPLALTTSLPDRVVSTCQT